MKAQRIPEADQKRYLEKRFEYLAHSRGGVYIVHLQQKGIVSHIVVIDAESRLIPDSAEEYPMKLSKDVLCLCSGPNAINLRVVEARLIVDQGNSHSAL